MEFKIKDQVQYRGSEVVFGVQDGTDVLKTAHMPPIALTYVWGIIPSTVDGDLYIIQHNKGVKREFFLKNADVFGTVDISELAPERHYVYVQEKDLVLLNRPQSATPEKPPTAAPTSPPVTPVTPPETDDAPPSAQEAEVPPVVEETTLKAEEPTIEPQEVEVPVTTSLSPHYDSKTCPESMMMDTVSLPRVIKSSKMTEPFTIENVKGEIEEGRAGDYLMLIDSNTVMIYPKELFEANFGYLNNLPTKRISKDSTYQLPEDVANYMNELETLNEELRKKSLDTPKEEEKTT